MAAGRVNYLVFYVNESQVWGSVQREVALSTPPPEGSSIEDKRVCFVTYQPDEQILSVHPLPLEEIRSAEIKWPKTKEKKNDEET